MNPPHPPTETNKTLNTKTQTTHAIETFTALPLTDFLQHALAHAKFVKPTPVQASSIPHALEGRDVLATASTGTGKTLAFLLPIMQRLLGKPALHDTKTGAQALILLPTRELAIQVVAQYNMLRGKKLGPAALVIGGVAEHEQLKALRAGARIIVSTPGRLEDFLDRKLAHLRDIEVLVLDECDRMLDMGFIPAIRRIAALLPKKRQTMCFSATLSPGVLHIVHDYMRDPIRIEIGSTLAPNVNVKLFMYEVPTEKKFGLLVRMLEQEEGRFLIFVRTKHGTDRLAKKLQQHKFDVAVMHGDRSQSQRNAALAGFQSGKHRILVATDVASRGIHVEDIAHVINYDLPKIAEDFVHRVGRTGRMDDLGSATTFVTPQERVEVRAIERTLKIKLERITLEGELITEFRSGPVDISKLKPQQISSNSKMVRMQGEVLQKHGDKAGI